MMAGYITCMLNILLFHMCLLLRVRKCLAVCWCLQGPRVTYVQPSSSAAGPLGVLQGQHLPQASNLSNSNTSQGVTLQLFAPGAAPHVRYILRTACSNDTASTPPLNIAGKQPRWRTIHMEWRHKNRVPAYVCVLCACT